MKLATTAACILGFSVLGLAQENHSNRPTFLSTGSGMEELSATVEQVFHLVDKDGYEFTSYQVSYQGHHIIVQDPINFTDLAVGQTLNFLAVRVDLSTSNKSGPKSISFMVQKNKSQPIQGASKE